ncbi:hypothetical protein CW748_13215 [Alteromonadales bacterium alter-6D02]|nr:hypothetical protein CW748_13215 [Alteromonadales bacterium alter-6D02]
MVLIYLKNPTSVPLVLDNNNQRVLPANKRKELRPIYSFNGNGLCLSKARERGRKVSNSKAVSAWNKLLL